MPHKEKTGKSTPAHPRRGMWLKIAIFLLLIVGTTVVLRPTLLRLQGQMEKIRDDFIREAEGLWGLKIRYGAMGPSIFGVLDIRNVTVLREDDSVFLSVARLRLSYSLLEILRGNSINAFHSVKVDRPVLNFDFVKDAGLRGHFQARGPSLSLQIDNESIQGLLPERFSVRVRNGEWELSDAFGKLKIQGVRLDASVRQNRVNFQGRWNAQISMSGSNSALLASVGSPVFEALMAGRISGEYSGELNEGSATVVIPSFSGSTFRLKPLSFSIYFSGSQLEIRKIYDRSPASFYLSYDFENSKLKGYLETENFSAGNLITFTGPWRDYNSALPVRVSGNAGFEWDKSGGFELNVEFSGSGPKDTLLEQALLRINAIGNKDEIIINNFDIHSSLGTLMFQGGVVINARGPGQNLVASIAPYGTFYLSGFRLHGNNGISGELYLNTNDREIKLLSENLSAGDVSLSSLEFCLYREEWGIDFTFSAQRLKVMDQRASSENVRLAVFSIDGTADYDPRQIQANLRLDSFSVGDILSFVEPLAPLTALPAFIRTAANDLSLTTDVFIITDYDQVLYNAPRVVVAYEGAINVMAVASFSGTGRGFELSTARISWDNGAAEFNGSVDFSDTYNISFSLGANLQNLNYFFEGLIQDKQNLFIRGSYGFQVFLAAGPTGTFNGYASGDMIPIPSGDKVASLNFLFSLFYDSPSYWSLGIDKFEVTGLSTPSSSFALLRFTGEAGDRGLFIPDLFFDDGLGALGGELALYWDSTYENCRFDVEVFSSNRVEYYGINGTYTDKQLQLLFLGQRMQLSRFSTINAEVDGSLQLFWESPSSFQVELLLPSFVLHRQNDIIRMSTVINLNNDELLADQLKINYAGIEVIVPSLKIDRRTSMAETEGRIWGLLSSRPLDISLSADAKFTYAETWVDLFRNFDFLETSLRVNYANYDDIEATEPFTFIFACRQENSGYAMTLDGGPRDMLRFRYNPERTGGGIFYAALSAPSPVRGAITGFVDPYSIDAQAPDLYVDLGSLWRFIPPNDAIEFPAGIVTASLRIGGTIFDPEFYGTARATSVQIRVPQFLKETIRPVPANFFFNGYDITFGPVDAVVGYGAGKASGWFRFDQWIPNIFNIDIQVPQEYPVPYDFDLSGLIAKGFASGRLGLAMEDMVLSITGDLTAHDTIISLDVGELTALESKSAFDSEDKKVSTIADLNIRTGRRVEFFWPSVDFPIIQANADLGTGIHVTSDAVAKRFTLNGDVNLRSGEIFYLERNFYIREGTLFFRENEIQFDPRISARAEIRDRTETGPVTISMIIDNAPLKSFTPRFVSSPPLSQLEIYSILGQYPQGEGEQRNLATSAVIDSLAQFTVIQRLQRQVRDFLGLDMFSMRTQLLQNMVIQATGIQQSENSDRSYRIGNYFDNTTIFIGKYFGAELFGEAMLSFRYEENKLDWGGLVLEPELGLEMRNPLFDIRFNMVPLHPENMFIDDVSFSVIWRRSF